MLNTYYIGVKAIIYDRSTASILILEKSAGNDSDIFFDLPGGRIEDSESLEQTLARELLEEIGLAIDPTEIDQNPIGMAQVTNNLLNTNVGLCLAYIPLSVDQQCELSLSSEHRSGSWYTQEAFNELIQSNPTALKESVPYIQQTFSLYSQT